MKRGKNFGSITVFDDRCALVYEPDDKGVICVVRCIPLDGQILYECLGHYDKRCKPLSYYLLASNGKEAKKRYRFFFGYEPWSLREIPPGDEAESILTNPNKMPL